MAAWTGTIIRFFVRKYLIGFSSGHAAETVAGTLAHSAVASRLRPGPAVLVSPSSPNPRRDLEPVNLNFTP